MNILFFGLGRISQRYLRLISKYHKKNIKNIYIIRYSKNSILIKDDLTSKYVKNINKFYNLKLTTFNKIESLNIDAAFLVNAPTNDRYDLILKLIKLKIHIFCEKPILAYIDNKKIKIIKKLIRKNRIIFFSAYQLRYHKFFNQLKSDIDKKKYGELKFIKMEISENFYLFNKYTTPEDSHYMNKEKGGGVLLAQCHEIDLLHYLLDELKIESVLIPSKPFYKRFEVDMLINLSFSCKKFNHTFPASLYMDMLNPIPKREGTFIFRNHLVGYNLRDNTSFIYNFNNNSLRKKKYLFERIELFKLELSNFFKLLNNKKENYTNFDEGLKSIITIDKIKNNG